MNKHKTKTIVFITGAFLSNQCWDDWITYFENRGYVAYAPAWPHKNLNPTVLRSWQNDSGIAALGLNDIYLHFENFIKELDNKPIVVGHSYGGLIMQLLMEKGLVEAGVAIHSIPPQGVRFSRFWFFSLFWNPIGYFKSIGNSYFLSFREWQFIFTNGFSLENQIELYEKYVVPESKLAIKEAFQLRQKLNYKLSHQPLLILAGTQDNFLPVSLVHANYKKYTNEYSVTDYRELDGRNHFSIKQHTWKIDADAIMDWIDNVTHS